MPTGPIPPRDLLILSRIPGIGPARLRSLVGYFNATGPIFTAPVRELAGVPGIDRKTALAIVTFLRNGIPSPALEYADAQMQRLSRIEGRFVSFWDDAYPEGLRRIYDPPPVLYCSGEILSRDSAAIAVVGTRTPSPYGTRVAERFAAGLAERGVTVVSGLARGIDTTAHHATLRTGGRTIAVIGSGLDIIYPAENIPLARSITRQGAVITEFGMGTKPDAVNFPQRNRIISGISLGTLVVETGTEGGAMITARTALDQNRDVFAIPSPVDGPGRSGTNALIREGNAHLTESVDDIVEELRAALAGLIGGVPVRPQPPPPALSLFEQRLYEHVAAEPVHIDLLSERSGLSTAESLVHLLSLEFKGVVRQLPGKFFVRR